MDIYLHDISKRYLREDIIQKMSHHFSPNSSTSIIGRNGSGKSTLLKLIAGIVPLSSGRIEYISDGVSLPEDSIFHQLSYCAPYQDLIEELTLKELIQFHLKFRRINISEDALLIADYMQLSHAINKQIFYFSSGMKQRVKLGLALLTDARITLLDEPTTNLDNFGIDWYLKLISNVIDSRTIIVASNQPIEYSFCRNAIDLSTK